MFLHKKFHTLCIITTLTATTFQLNAQQPTGTQFSIILPHAELPDVRDVLSKFGESIDTFNKVVNNGPYVMTVAGLCLLSGYQLFIKSPHKNADQRNWKIDFALPLAGLCASSYVLWHLYAH